MNDSVETGKTGFAFDSLEAVRRKLLDLTGRNSLLAYKHPRASCVRLIDELPNQIMEALQEGEALTFIPVPEPTEKQLIKAGFIKIDSVTGKKEVGEFPSAMQWAKYIGLNIQYDLPIKETVHHGESKHVDSNLQTLLYAPELEARLRSIKGKADTAIDECGSNILYLVIGFLEWYESSDSELPRYAPLFTLPLQIKRASLDANEGVYRYTIELKDDGILTNITLKQKLANDFGLILPDIEENVLPEDYFELISKTILKQKPNWAIKRNITLALLDFAKQAMYQDLDPENWPAHQNIKDHLIIQQFFSSVETREESANAVYASEHDIDVVPNIHGKYPLIYDADSSQHSAVIDAVSGDNLVIEGPPGSGKSQTITNLIAASIANGKSVLFVAEKMAALNVVRNRLDNAGLGDFCLELHSHKTNKLQILNDLSLRLAKQQEYSNPKSIDIEIQRLEDLRQKLNAYVEVINSPWKNTGLTLHSIFNRATRYREELKIDPEQLKIPNLNGESCSVIRQKDLFDQADMLKDIYLQVSQQTVNENIEDHYWYGVNNVELTSHTSETLISYLRQWTDYLIRFNEKWIEKSSVLGISQYYQDFESITSLFDAIKELPDLIGNEPLSEINYIQENRLAFREFIDLYIQIHQDLDLLLKTFKKECIFDEARNSGISSGLITLQQLGVTSEVSISQLLQNYVVLKNSYEAGNSLVKKLEEIKSRLPIELHVICELSQQGIEEFRKCVRLIKSLPMDLWRHRDDMFDNPDLDAVINALKPKLKHLASLHAELADNIYLDKLPPVNELINLKSILDHSTIFSFFSSEWRKARSTLRALSKIPKQKTKKLVEFLPDVIDYAKEIVEVEKINKEERALGNQFKGIETPIDRISVLRNWYKSIRQEYGIGFGSRVQMGTSLLAMDREVAQAIIHIANQEIFSALDAFQAEIQKTKNVFVEFKPLFDPAALLCGSGSVLKKLLLQLHGSLGPLKDSTNTPAITLQVLDTAVKSLATFDRNVKLWKAHQVTLKLVPNYFDISLESFNFNQQFVQLAENSLAIVDKLYSSPNLWALIKDGDSPKSQYVSLKNLPSDFKDLSPFVQKHQDEFVELGKVSYKEWVAASTSILPTLIKRNQMALSKPNWLNTWVDYIRIRAKISAQGLGNIVENLESKNINANSITQVLNLVIYDQLAKEALVDNPSLGLFSGLEQMAIRNKYQEYDRLLLGLQRQKIAFSASRTSPPIGNSSGRVSTYTETSLIRHEANKKTRHISVRNLLLGAGTSIRILKPCFMMSPMSVAQYLKPGDFLFDLVVMDEASQIRPEDALGAIARGKSVVIVGDPKQLPPTSFFQKTVEVEDSEENVALEESESILDAVVPMFKNRRLRWHYRSRHESLIAFSNKHFYDENLILFPSPFQESREFGVKFNKVHKGRFVNRRNVEEAKSVVEDIAKHLREFPHESIGVVAMSSEQRDEIEKQFEQLRKDDNQVRAAFERNEISAEPLFIKNLENVQGDERDVIVISMTYGPEQIGGRTMQRFGPINSDAGWRRLNVLFTRSKKRMHIFSSMSSGDVIVSTSSKRGVKSLRAFLEYCETGHLHHVQHTGKAADSDFEIAVMRALQVYGYECEPQLGVAGYFLDLAVRDPGNNGRFLLGIECDGATYHSAKSTRDRDRLRQEILEGLGWKIKRIWSTDWFKNPQAQLQPILNELARLKTPIVEKPDPENVSTDSLEEITENNIQHIEESFAPSFIQESDLTLKERLQIFNETIIKVEQPETPDDARLLRPSMMDALLSHLPSSKAEFFELIPEYIRKGTSANEDKYLDGVLELIADYGEFEESD